ncbi:alcohol dehydrogenase [Moniliophthora roreri]|nr:alcohol dehydrogenase [Moniliophthora roreri]
MSLPSTQKAVRWYPPKYNIRVETVPIPEIQEPDDVIVKVKFAGLCGSDLHTYRGHEGEDLAPHICGHEFIGEVVRLGPSFGPGPKGRPDLYSTLKVGDKVVSPFTTSCGECRYCRLGFTCRCPKGALFGCPILDGAQAQYVRVPIAGGTLYNLSDPQSWASLLPDQSVAEKLDAISDTSLLLLGDVLPTGLFAAVQALNHPKLSPFLRGISWPPRPGDASGALTMSDRALTFAVIGLGPVGICACVALLDQLSEVSVPYRIVAIDPLESRREKAKMIYSLITQDKGRNEFVVQSIDDAKYTVKEWTTGTGCTAVLEVVGNPGALKLSYELVQPFGVISSVGVHGAPQVPFTGGNLYDKNVSFDFGRCPARAMFPMAFELLVKRQDVFGEMGSSTSLIERVVKIDDAVEMYKEFDQGRTGKVIFDPWHTFHWKVDDPPRTMSRSKGKGISASSFFDLKAELSRKEEEIQRNKAAGKSTAIIGGVPRPDKKPTIWSRQNKGVKGRAARDVELEAISKPNLESPRTALERKSRIYDKLKKGKSGGLSEAQYDVLLVDFESKGIDSRWESDSDDVDESTTVPALIDEADEIIEYEDEHGRTRTAPRSEIPLEYLPEIRAKMSNENNDEDDVIRNPVNHWVSYTPDDDRRARIEREFSEENNPMNVHYNPNNEVRDRGAASYNFSRDEETRRAQQEALRASRTETEQAREKSGAVDVRPGEVEGMVENSGTTQSRAMEKRKREIEERRKMVEAKRKKVSSEEDDVSKAKQKTDDPQTAAVLVARANDPFVVLEAASSSSKETIHNVNGKGRALHEADNFLVVVLTYLLCWPFTFTSLVLYKKWAISRAATSFGAVLPPTSDDDPTPGGILTLLRAVRNFKAEYIADGLQNKLDRIGYTFNMRILFKDRIVTCEPEYIKALLATRFDEFEKGWSLIYSSIAFSDSRVSGETTRTTFSSLLGTGVFAADGELWKFHRSITRPFFSKDRISHFDIFDRHADVAIAQMKKRFGEGYPVDFQDVVSRFTLDSATEFLFGKDVQTLSGTLPYPFYSSLANVSTDLSDEIRNKFVQSFNGAQNATALRARFGDEWPLFEFWKDKTKEKMKDVNRFLEPVLTEALQRQRGKGGIHKLGVDREVKEGETVLDHLVNYTDDPVILRDEIMNLAVAGRDTTASILTFTVYMLSQHPKIFRRLREEIFTKIGSSRRPTFDDFRDMKYLRAVLNEVLRLYPPVQSKAGVVLPSLEGKKPFYIPPETRVAYGVFIMHRRTDLWGPDALEFDPDRFLDERLHKYLTPNPFIFLPFNAGPRICLGQQFAYHEASFFLVRLLQQFCSIRFSEEAQPPSARPPPRWKDERGIKARERVQIRSHLTMYVVDGLWVTMEEASDED